MKADWRERTVVVLILLGILLNFVFWVALLYLGIDVVSKL